MNTTVSKAVAAHTTSGMAVIVLLWLAQTYGHLAMPVYVAAAIVGLAGTFTNVISHLRFVQTWFMSPEPKGAAPSVLEPTPLNHITKDITPTPSEKAAQAA